MLASFVPALVLFILMDIIFDSYLFPPYASFLRSSFGIVLDSSTVIDVGWLPEVWLAILVLGVGTLIVVVSIVAQNIPKIVDIYMEDWISLGFLWFLVMSGMHGMYSKVSSEIIGFRLSSVVLNMNFLFIISVILSVPYIFYILRQTQPINVIRTITRQDIRLIQSLPTFYSRILFTIPDIVEDYQERMYRSLNQLSDILEYIDFQEVKTEVVIRMTNSLKEYIEIKSRVNPNFFQITDVVRSELKLYGEAALTEIEERGEFYEEKFYSVLRNAYSKALDNNEYELLGLIGRQLHSTGTIIVENGHDNMLDFLIIQFNTLMRFTIKHGVAFNDARNLYNLLWAYGEFLSDLARNKKEEHILRYSMYLRFYWTEALQHAGNAPAMHFVVDVFAAEIKNILSIICRNEWDLPVQEEILKKTLIMGAPLRYKQKALSKGIIGYKGFRILQTALSLFYLNEGMEKLAKILIEDILEDHSPLGDTLFGELIESICQQLRVSGKTFWEKTERGSVNIYYTDDKPQIEYFKVLVDRGVNKLARKS